MYLVLVIPSGDARVWFAVRFRDAVFVVEDERGTRAILTFACKCVRPQGSFR